MANLVRPAWIETPQRLKLSVQLNMKIGELSNLSMPFTTDRQQLLSLANQTNWPPSVSIRNDQNAFRKPKNETEWNRMKQF